MTTEDLWYQRLRPRAASEAALIANAFWDEHRIRIGGYPDAAEQDASVIPGGIGYMYAEGRLLVREQYVEQVQDILRRRGAESYSASRRVIDSIVLLRQNANADKGTPESDKGSAESDDRNTVGDNEPTGGDDGIAQGNAEPPVGDQPSVPDLLDSIDEELGVGIATPDHVLTAAEMAGCPATEPEEFYGPREPYPPVCRGDGGEGVRIFIADTGLLENAAQEFPWLHDVKGGTDHRLGQGGQIQPYAGHGTFVAGVVRCMAPGATVRVENIFNTAGSALESHFVRRLNRAFEFGPEIVHLTASCMTRNNYQLIALEAWLKLLEPYKGVLCIAPAGNHHTRRPSWPGAFPGVLSVGALSTDWRSRAYFSDYGSHVDVYAPGQNLINAYATGTYKCYIAPYIGEMRTFHGLAQWSGTSFSTPIVTGLVAARMARLGENGREAAAALLAKARTQRIPGVGPVLLPDCGDEDGGCGDGDRGRCCGRCGGDGCRCGGGGCRCAGGRRLP